MSDRHVITIDELIHAEKVKNLTFVYSQNQCACIYCGRALPPDGKTLMNREGERGAGAAGLGVVEGWPLRD